MLGAEAPSAARYAGEVFSRGSWAGSDITGGHEGYAWSQYTALINRATPPPEIAGSIGRQLERLTWHLIHVARLLERAIATTGAM